MARDRWFSPADEDSRKKGEGTTRSTKGKNLKSQVGGFFITEFGSFAFFLEPFS
jgi:hypothetical protein